MSAMKDRDADIHALDLPALCRHGQLLQGRTPLAGLTRLVDALFAAPTADDAVTWSAQGSLLPVAGGEAQLWLALKAQALVQLQCQRCLQPLAQTLVLERRVRFVRDEDEAARLDEESEDDVLAMPARLDLHGLLEDELILALPLVPRHEECPRPLPLKEIATAESEKALNPFAALAALRGRQSD